MSSCRTNCSERPAPLSPDNDITEPGVRFLKCTTVLILTKSGYHQLRCICRNRRLRNHALLLGGF